MQKHKQSLTDPRDFMLSRGVESLRKFGYPSCDKENILTDMIFREFFKSDLEDVAKEAGIPTQYREVASRLLAEIAANEGKKGKKK